MKRISAFLRQFMLGRYGTDKLNMAILYTGLACVLLDMFIRQPILNVMLTAISYGLMVWAIFRMLSRNTYKRYQENRKYMRFLERIKDRELRRYRRNECTNRLHV